METIFGRIVAIGHAVRARRSPNGLVGIALLICVSVLCSGCLVEFTNPLPGSRRFTADRNLLGRWSGVDEQGNPGFIQFDKAGSREMVVSVFGKDSNLGYTNPVFRLTTTKIGAMECLILKPGRSDSKFHQTIAKYSIERNKLKIWVLSVERVEEAIRNGQLHGAASGGPADGVVVSSSPEEVLRFIEHAHDELFSLLGEYQRVPR